MDKIIVFILIVLLASGFLYVTSTEIPKSTPLIINQSPIVSPLPQEKTEGELLIERINSKNSQIHNISYDLDIESQQNGRLVIHLKGFLAYEKSRCFRQKTSSIFGEESDIGSNDQLFWFWSKRNKPPALHYAVHEDLYKTRLKTPFNPAWMMECLGINEINLQGGLMRTETHWVVVEKSISPSCQIVTKMTAIDPATERITGHYLFDPMGQIEASTEILEFENDIPKKILIIWHKENIKMLWTVKNVKVNTQLNPDLWEMPNMSYKIDMGKN